MKQLTSEGWRWHAGAPALTFWRCTDVASGRDRLSWAARDPTVLDVEAIAGWHPIRSRRSLTWWSTADVEPWVMLDAEGSLIGYGEIWVDAEEDEVELARLIVPEALRGRGLGKLLVQSAAADGGREGYGDDVPSGGARQRSGDRLLSRRAASTDSDPRSRRCGTKASAGSGCG